MRGRFARESWVCLPASAARWLHGLGFDLMNKTEIARYVRVSIERSGDLKILTKSMSSSIMVTIITSKAKKKIRARALTKYLSGETLHRVAIRISLAEVFIYPYLLLSVPYALLMSYLLTRFPLRYLSAVSPSYLAFLSFFVVGVGGSLLVSFLYAKLFTRRLISYALSRSIYWRLRVLADFGETIDDEAATTRDRRAAGLRVRRLVKKSGNMLTERWLFLGGRKRSDSWSRASAVQQRLEWLILNLEDRHRRDHLDHVLVAALVQTVGERPEEPPVLPRLPYGKLPPLLERRPLSFKLRNVAASSFVVALITLTGTVLGVVAKFK
jgi:hypothetical protein